MIRNLIQTQTNSNNNNTINILIGFLGNLGSLRGNCSLLGENELLHLS